MIGFHVLDKKLVGLMSVSGSTLLSNSESSFDSEGWSRSNPSLEGTYFP